MIQASFTAQRKSRWGFNLGMLALLVLMLFSAFLFKRYLEYLDWAERTQGVLNKISAVSILMERSEAGYRGYLYSHNTRYLTRYHVAASSIQKELKDLEIRLEDKQANSKAFLTLKQGITELYRGHEDVLRNEKKLSKNEIMDRFLVVDMTEIRDAMEQIEQSEKATLAAKKASSDFLMNSGFTLIVLGTLTSLGLLVWSRRSLSSTARKAFAQNSLLNSIMENLNEGLIVVDREGLVIVSNAPMEKIIGLNVSGLKLSNQAQFLSFFDPLTGQILAAEELPLARSLKGEVVNQTEILVRSRTLAKETYLRANSRPVLDSSGQVVGAMALYQDITKNKQMEEEWQKAREAALEASRLKSEFLNEMGHEIRTPMNGVIGMANLLANSDLDGEQKSFVKNIQVSAHYLLSMIQNVLDQSLIDRGLFKIERSPFKLGEMLQHVLTILEPLGKEREVQLFLDSDIETNLEIISDSVRIQEVLLEVLQRGIRQTHKGFVSLKVRVLEVFDGKARIFFEIKNSGTISQESEKVESELKHRLWSEIVEQLGGEVETEAQKDFGTRCSLTFDFELKESNQRKIVRRHSQIHSEKPVLVAEDQAINQMVIKKYLERFGLQCHIVVDGRSAFLEATTGKYCLVLMDCKMQPIDGYEATQLIRTHEKSLLSSRIPIVALTADGSVEDRKRCEQVGMDDYVVKPIDLEKLENVLQKWIQPVLHEEYLRKLDGYSMEGRPLIEVLAEDYLASAPSLITNLEEALTSGNLKQVQYFSHTLKSSSVTLGLVELGSFCEKLERVTELRSVAPNLMSQIKDAFKKGEPVLRKRISLN